MAATIGIRREDKNRWERRVPLPPEHVARLVRAGLEIVVQPSDLRAFPDAAYAGAGARLDEDLNGCPVVLAVKEVPVELLRPERTYVTFAHVIKGQPANMPMLRRLLELSCTLVDYERVVDETGRRLVLFGRHAGLAGMLDALWALGRRLEAEGLRTPLSSLRPAHDYAGLDDAKAAVEVVGRRIRSKGVPASLAPLTVGFAGYGNTSQGAQEVFDLLPHEEVAPEDLAGLSTHEQHRLFKVVFHERHLVEPADPKARFELQDYYDHPAHYRGVFSRHVPALTLLMNCTYWEERYPRLVPLLLLRELWAGGARPRLRVIGDVSCDLHGAIECTVRCTTPDDPVYVWEPATGDVVPGVEGDGPVVLAVDNLPCELPVESSAEFGEALLPLVEPLARADWSRPFDELELPDPIRRGVIVHRGELTPQYEHLKEHLD